MILPFSTARSYLLLVEETTELDSITIKLRDITEDLEDATLKVYTRTQRWRWYSGEK
jgi:hypothetical protein